MNSSTAHSSQPVTWHELPRAAFDLETTSANPQEARIVTANITIINGRAEIIQSHDWLVNPGIDIPAETTQIHGVTTEQARAEGRNAAEAVQEISTLLEQLMQTMPVIVFNAPYDFTVLASESARHHLPVLDPSPVIDPLVLDRKHDRFRRGKRTLVVMSEHYGIPLNRAHTAKADAVAAAGIADEIARRYPNEIQVDPLLLHGQQVQWHTEWAENFQDFLRRKNPTAVVDPAWPISMPGTSDS